MNSFQVPIYNYIRRLVVSHEDAEDVLQEVFIRIFRHIDQFREESSLSTWIYRIATNESLRLLNSRKEEGVISAEDVQEEWKKGTPLAPELLSAFEVLHSKEELEEKKIERKKEQA